MSGIHYVRLLPGLLMISEVIEILRWKEFSEVSSRNDVITTLS